MKEKRAAIGFKGLVLAPVTQNTLTHYKTGEGVPLPHVGGMTRTAKESTTDLFYDDSIYAQIKDIVGEEVEIRVAEVEAKRMEELGAGVWDETTQTLEGDFSITGKDYAVRCVVDTVDRLPFYFNFRLFELTGIRFDNFATKKDSITVCEVIITGIFKKPQMPSVATWARMQLKADKSNEAACTAFLTAEEEKGTAPTGG